MSRPFDLTLKYLLDTYPTDVLGQLLGLAVAGPVTYLETELRADARTADALLQVPLAGHTTALVHLEVQTRYAPDVPARMLDYAVRIHHKHGEPVQSWLLVLLAPGPGQEAVRDGVRWGDVEQGPGLAFRYGVVRVWELDPATGLSLPGLLPLVPLMQRAEPTPATLDACATQIDTWAPLAAERQNLLWCVGNLASLRYDQAIVRDWLRRVGMVETPLMQALRAEGEAQALLTILQTRGLAVTEAQRERILGCQDTAQLEDWLRRAVTAAATEAVLG